MYVCMFVRLYVCMYLKMVNVRYQYGDRLYAMIVNYSIKYDRKILELSNAPLNMKKYNTSL